MSALGALLLRLLLAGLLFGHATQKLFGWFGGTGPAGTGEIFEKWGFVPGRRMAVLAGCTELLGAASIAAGFLTPGGCAVVIGTMTVAAVATAPNGFWAQKGGCEVPFCYGALAVVVGFGGPGEWSLDHAFGLTALADPLWGLAALVVGLAAAAVPLTMRARVLRSRGSITKR
ncbi:putative oxidoreductase [Kibdelosporangium banguiense]|uniref:Oxidoreductase n=1 Tax=Kibdelosporangium banguiense TaxID=1365924 RepID=A0ABS4U113_9PSEU|nr:DoxX family protein [Kibdelosporangium banguiense]MBP2330342.1 putative oxidoreductase [Kibdelosporangium banguiense]